MMSMKNLEKVIDSTLSS